MDAEEILSFIEDKDITANDSWYFHATRSDIDIIKKILKEGIKSAYLRNKKGNHFNGQYYISLYKNTKEYEDLNLWLIDAPKFIIHDISPLYADRKKYNFRRMFINTRIPLRTSEWDGEYQQYLEMEASKIIALEYSLSHILSKSNGSNIKENLIFLRNMVLCIEQIGKDLPIYDLSSNREFNKQKILSLNL